MYQNRRKKLGVVSLERKSVLDSLFSRALGFADQAGDPQLRQAVGALSCLEEPTSAQVKETIGLLDGLTELSSRYGKIASAERERVREPVETDEDMDCDDEPQPGDCGCHEQRDNCTKARDFNSRPYVCALKRVRVNLSAAAVLLESNEVPGGPKELISVPASTGGSEGSGEPRRR